MSGLIATYFEKRKIKLNSILDGLSDSDVEMRFLKNVSLLLSRPAFPRELSLQSIIFAPFSSYVATTYSTMLKNIQFN